MIAKLKRFLLNRLDERSTWRAVVALLTLAGIGLTPEQSESVIVAGVAIGALIEAFLPDPGGRIHEPKPEQLPQSEVQRVSEAGAEPNRRSAADESRGTWLGN